MKRKLLSVVLSLAMVVGMLPMTVLAAETDDWATVAATAVAGEDYTTSGEYVDTVSTALGLAYFASQVNSGNTYYGKTVTLTTDIDLLNAEWTPIGNSSNLFQGTFDGGKNTISNLSVTETADYQGLFGYINYAATIENVTVTGTVSGGQYAGGIVGLLFTNCTVSNCHSSVSVTGQYAGGIAGQNSGTIDGCSNTGAVTCTDTESSFVGGIAGNNTGTVSNSYNTANIAYTGSVQNIMLGGIVGYGSNCTISQCYNTGAVSADSTAGYNNSVGGIVGRISTKCLVINCYNTGAVTDNNGGGVAGGIAGYTNSDDIENCYNWGNVSGVANAGGIAGSAAMSDLANCYSTATVSASDSNGGSDPIAVDALYSTATGCYSLSDGTFVLSGDDTTTKTTADLQDTLNAWVAAANSDAYYTWELEETYPTFGDYYVPTDSNDDSTPATDFDYTIADDAVTITGYTGSETVIELPSTIEGYPVTAIGEGAFDSVASSVTSILIPDSVTSIYITAFNDCTALESIVVDEESETYKSVDGVLFSKNGTTLVRYPEGKTGTSYTVPADVTDLGWYAFRSNKALETVTLREGLTTINKYAFYYCEGLTSMHIPSTVSSINVPFQYCYNIPAYTVDADSTYFCAVDGVLFDYDMKTLIQYPLGDSTRTTYTIPSGVETISEKAFMGYNNLLPITEIDVPSTVSTVATFAFANLSYLEKITFNSPDAVFAGNVFSNTTGVTIYGYADSTAYDQAVAYGLGFVALDDDGTDDGATGLGYDVLIPTDLSFGDSDYSVYPYLYWTGGGAGDKAFVAYYKADAAEWVHSSTVLSDKDDYAQSLQFTQTTPGTYTKAAVAVVEDFSDTMTTTMFDAIWAAGEYAVIDINVTITNETITDTLTLTQGTTISDGSVPFTATGLTAGASFRLTKVVDYNSATLAATVTSSGSATVYDSSTDGVWYFGIGAGNLDALTDATITAYTAAVTSDDDGYTLDFTYYTNIGFVFADTDDGDDDVTPTTYAITSADTTNGSFGVSATTAEAETSVTITVTPADGYVVDTVTVTGDSGDVIDVTDNAFIMPEEAVTVSVTFKETAKIAQSIALGEIEAKTYGDEAFTLTASGTTGSGDITYSSSNTAVITIAGNVATIVGAGDVTITVTIAEDDDYASATDSQSVTVAKATPDYALPTGLTATYGDTLGDVTLPDGFAFNDSAFESVGTVGTNPFNVTYTPDNTDNYNVLDNLSVSVVVSAATATGSLYLELIDEDEDGAVNAGDNLSVFYFFNLTGETVSAYQWYKNGEAIADATSTAYTLVDCEAGDTYYCVATLTGNTVGAVTSESITVGTTAPAAPVITASAGNKQVTITWATPADGGSDLIDYVLCVGVGDDYTSAYTFTDMTMTSYVVTELTNGTTYTFKLIVANAIGSAESNEVTAKPYTSSSSSSSSSSGSSSSSSSSSSSDTTDTTTTETTTATTTTDNVTVESTTETTTNDDGSTVTETVETATNEDTGEVVATTTIETAVEHEDGSVTTEIASTSTNETTGEVTVTTATATTTVTDDGATVTETVAVTTNETSGDVTESVSTETVSETAVTVETQAVTTTANGDVIAETVTVIADTETATEITATVATENGETTAAQIIAVATDDTTDVTIPQDVLTTVAAEEAATITVQTADVEIVLDPTATNTVADALAAATEEQVVITAVAVESAVVSDTITADLNNIVVVDLTISVGGETVSNFNGGTATVSIPYTPINEAAPITVYYVADDGSVTLMPCTYDAETGMVVFETTHFSYYMLSENDAIAFTDVAVNAYYYEAVKWAVEYNVISGYSDGTFRPTASCTRAQAVTFLWRAAGEPVATIDNPFVDLDETAYYYQAVLWAVENGITTGYEDGTFRPNATCNRGAIVTFLYRFAGEPDVTGEAEEIASDVASGAYYYDAVLWAMENGITTGYEDGTFRPSTTCNRGAIVTFLYRYLAE